MFYRRSQATAILAFPSITPLTHWQRSSSLMFLHFRYRGPFNQSLLNMGSIANITCPCLVGVSFFPNLHFNQFLTIWPLHNCSDVSRTFHFIWQWNHSHKFWLFGFLVCWNSTFKNICFFAKGHNFSRSLCKLRKTLFL